MSKLDYEWPDIDVKALVRKHRARASEYMREKGIDLLLLNEHDLIHTLIGQPSMKFHDAFQAVRYLVDQDFKGVFFSPFTPEPEAEYHFPTVEGIEKSISVGNDAFWWDLQVEVLVREISDRGAKRVGVDRAFPDIHFEVQRRLPNVEFVPILLDLRDMREIKFPEEIAEMEVAAKICARGHAICMEEAWIGITDGELAGIFSKYVLSQLVQYPANLYNLKGPTFETWGILGHTLNDGDNIVIDYGVHSRLGMQAEMGRTMWVGTPDPKFADQCARHADATLDVCHNVLKPGMNRVEIQDAFMDAFRKVGLGDLLGDYLHMLGHNNGFRMPEPPSLDMSPIGMKWGVEGILREGQIMMMEPMLISENKGDKFAMIQNEDIWVVEANGLRLLSTECGYMGRDYK